MNSRTQRTQEPSSHVAPDAVDLLLQDHKEVKAMFSAFKKLKDTDDDGEDKVELVKRICTALTIHATIEEEIFYPAVRAGIKDQDLMDEADVEHAGAKELIAQLEGSSPGDDHRCVSLGVHGASSVSSS